MIRANTQKRDKFSALEMDDMTGADPAAGAAPAGLVAPPGTDFQGGFSVLSIGTLSGPRPEGQSGATPMTFTVFRSGDLSRTASATWHVAGTGAAAANGADFVGGVLPFGTVAFAAGETMKTITVQVAGDHLLETNETFSVVLTSSAADVHIGSDSVTGTIVNDDAKALISIHARDPFLWEGDVGAVAFRYDVVREGDASRAGTVDWAVSGTGAAPADAADFAGGVLPHGTVSFAAGETVKTITVLVAGDREIEADETFQVALTTSASDATIVSGVATGLIVHDDAKAVVSLYAHDQFQWEGDTGSVTFTYDVVRSGDIDRVASVNWKVSGIATDVNDATPVDGADFVGGVLPSGSLTFGIGETHKTVTFKAAGDRLIENNEAFQVALTTSASDIQIGTAPVEGLIVNDDAKSVIRMNALSDYQFEPDTGSVAFKYAVYREGDVDRVASVNWQVSGTGASPANAADFVGGVLPHGTITFGIGETATKYITVQVAGDRLIEADETFQVALSPGASDVLAGGVVTGEIVNDDAKSVIRMNALSDYQFEPDTGLVEFKYAVYREGDVDRAASVNWQVSGSGASPANAADFVGGVLPHGTITFGIGETATKYITVQVAGDRLIEADETFQVALSPGASDVLAGGVVTGEIVNDDHQAVVSLYTFDDFKYEGDTGTTAFTYDVLRDGDRDRVATVDWQVSGTGAAPVNAADFAGGVLPHGSLTFGVGETHKTIVVLAKGDRSVETNETFQVALSTSAGDVQIGNAPVAGLIINDDAPALLSISAVGGPKLEGNSGATPFLFNVVRSGDTNRAASAAWHVSGAGTAPADAADFVGGALPSGTVAFAPGEIVKTIAVQVRGDTAIETDETFAIKLTSGSADVGIVHADAAGTILSDELPAKISIAALHADRAEGDRGTTPFTFTVTRTGEPGLTVSARWEAMAGGVIPADADDFVGGVFPSGVVTFGPQEFSKILTVDVAGDLAVEAPNGFVVKLTAPSAGATIETATAAGLIKNDDFLQSPSIAAGLNIGSPAMSFIGDDTAALLPEAAPAADLSSERFFTGPLDGALALSDFSETQNVLFGGEGGEQAMGGLGGWMPMEDRTGMMPAFSHLG